MTLPLLFAEAWSPRAIRINGWRYSGMLEADLVVRAVCSGFIHMHLGFSCSYGPEASSCAEERRELKHSTDFFDGQHSLHMFEPSRVLVLSFVGLLVYFTQLSSCSHSALLTTHWILHPTFSTSICAHLSRLFFGDWAKIFSVWEGAEFDLHSIFLWRCPVALSVFILKSHSPLLIFPF